MAKSEASYWEDQARDTSRASLTKIRATATAWAGTTATLLGLFGTVAIISGPDALKDLSDDVQGVVFGLTLVAVALAGVAVVATALASQGIPKKYSPLTGLRLARYTQGQAGTAATQLVIGRVTAIGAALLIVVAGLVAMWATMNEPAGKTFALVRTSGGEIQCGELTRDATGKLYLSNKGQTLIQLTTEIESAEVVDSCP